MTTHPMTNTLARSVLDARKKGVQLSEANVLIALANNQALINEGRKIDAAMIDEFNAATRRYNLAVGALNEAQAQVDEILRNDGDKP